MSSDHRAFAQIVLGAFTARGHYTDLAIKDAGGPSSTYMTGLRKAAEDGEPLRPLRSDTATRIDAAAGWKPGTALELWRTGELPRGHDARAAAPSALASVDEVSGAIRREADGAVRGVVTSVANLPDGESRMEIHYWPGPGRSITSIDLMTAVGGAHRAALNATYFDEEGGGEHDRSAANQMPESGPADQPDRIRLAPAADRRKGRSTGRRLRQEQDAAGEAGDELPPDD